MNFFGIPLELLTMLGSSVVGGLMTLWSQKIKSRQADHAMTIAALSKEGELVHQARTYDKPEFQFTRRLIALAATFAVIVWPKLVPVFWPEIAVTVGYTQWTPGFLFFSGTEEVRWQIASGLVLTPLDTHLMSSIIGLYFGASVVRNAR